MRPERRAALIAHSVAEITISGLSGDHGRPGKRAVTLLQAEHLAVIAALSDTPELVPELLRRNLLISGLNLAATRGCSLDISGVRLRVTGPCAPCSRMEEALGPGGYNAMRGHGGWCAEVLAGGTVRLGAPVMVCDQVAPPLAQT